MYDKDYKKIVRNFNEIENGKIYFCWKKWNNKYNNQDRTMMTSILTIENIKNNKINDMGYKCR